MNAKLTTLLHTRTPTPTPPYTLIPPNPHPHPYIYPSTYLSEQFISRFLNVLHEVMLSLELFLIFCHCFHLYNERVGRVGGGV